MNRDDARDLVREVKGAYPAWRLDDPETTINVWLKILEPYDYELCKTALYKYMDSEERTYAPQPNQIKNVIDRLLGRGGSYCTMIYTERTQSIRWQPEGSDKVYDIPVHWDEKHIFLVDDEGREYADPNWFKER